MEYNLLQLKYDDITEMFINGSIPYDLYIEMEEVYLLKLPLFIINLN